PLTFQHRAGVSPYTSPFGFAETCVFDKQSFGPIHCGFSDEKHPFSLSYGVILPSSLTRVLPLTLGFSPRLPVSVCGTGTSFLTRGFSSQCGIRNFGTIVPSPLPLRMSWTDLPIQHPNCLTAHIHACAFLILLRPAVAPTERLCTVPFYVLFIVYAVRL